MTATRLDHLVVAATRLQQGIEHIENLLGVSVALGGRHPRMGTHNALLRLGPALYLEIIAIDPTAEPPTRPRWFGLDEPAVRAWLAPRPRLLHWVVNTPDIETAREHGRIPPGRIEPMSRGDLHWRITIAEDGHTPAGGLLPSLIQWHTEAHPADRLPDSGCRLSALVVRSPHRDWLEAALKPIGADQLVELQAAAEASLHARIETPAGERLLD